MPMGIQEVVDKLRKEDGVCEIFILEGDNFKAAIDEEKSVVESSMGMPMVNKALEECLKRNTFLCICCDYTFEQPTEHIMLMEDGDGNIIGHDIPICMIDDFKDREDIVWLCDDFAMFPQKATSEEMYIIMLPQHVNAIGPAEGVMDPVILYPATTTDMVLKKLFNMQDRPELATAILAFDM